LPSENQELFGYGSFSVAKAGKLKVNNKVIIKLHAYPYREYGSIDGVVDKISDFPIEGMYAVKIRLPKKLKTGYDKKIIFKQRLSGDAELITENRSLLSRVFSNFKYFIEENVVKE
jgi:HlyD family secretion protein